MVLRALRLKEHVVGTGNSGKVANNLEMRYVTVGITTKAVQEAH
jgi:hypothetical protein